jgi:uridine phosphorylase
MKRFVTFNTGDKMYHLEIDKAYPNVLSAGSPGRIRRIANYLDKVEEIIESDRGLVTVHGEYKKMPITAFSTGMGPASVSVVLPEIIEACDDLDMNILRLGTCGGLKEILNIGDFIITTEAKRKESTSDKIMGKRYRAISDSCFREILAITASKFKASFQQVYIGKTKVVDDIYFHDLGSKNKKHDCLAVSMEFSVYCALRDRYNRDFGKNIKVGNLLVVSDNVVKKQEHIDMDEFLRRKEQIEERHIKIGLETLLEMSY